MERDLSQSDVTVRPFEERDIEAATEIQTQSREAAQWSRTDYEAFASGSRPCFAAENEGRVVGFLAGRKLADEMEILNLAVEPAARRQGIAGGLLREAMNWGARNGIRKVHLEARAANMAARAFYEKHGFRATGTRRNYYREPCDDAVLLMAPVTNK